MWKYILFGVAAGAVCGIGIGVYKVIKNAKKEANDDLESLLKNQYSCDTVDREAMIKWYQNNSSLAKGEPFWFLLKPTAESFSMLGLRDFHNQLDQDRNLLQAVVDKASNLPVAIRVVSFSTIDGDLFQMFKKNSKDYIIITH